MRVRDHAVSKGGARNHLTFPASAMPLLSHQGPDAPRSASSPLCPALAPPSCRDRRKVDYNMIRARINELSPRYPMSDIPIGRGNANQLALQLTDDVFEVEGFGQGSGRRERTL